MRRSGLEIIEQIFYNDIDGRAKAHSEQYRQSAKELTDMLEYVAAKDKGFMIKLESTIMANLFSAEHDAFVRGFMLARRLLFPVDGEAGQ